MEALRVATAAGCTDDRGITLHAKIEDQTASHEGNMRGGASDMRHANDTTLDEESSLSPLLPAPPRVERSSCDSAADCVNGNALPRCENAEIMTETTDIAVIGKPYPEASTPIGDHAASVERSATTSADIKTRSVRESITNAVDGGHETSNVPSVTADLPHGANHETLDERKEGDEKSLTSDVGNGRALRDRLIGDIGIRSTFTRMIGCRGGDKDSEGHDDRRQCQHERRQSPEDEHSEVTEPQGWEATHEDPMKKGSDDDGVEDKRQEDMRRVRVAQSLAIYRAQIATERREEEASTLFVSLGLSRIHLRNERFCIRLRSNSDISFDPLPFPGGTATRGKWSRN